MTEENKITAQKENKKRSFSDVVNEKFYPDLPEVEFKELVGKRIEWLDGKILRDLQGDYGRHDAALLKGKFAADDTTAPAVLRGKEFTTISSGVVIVRKVNEVIEKRAFPLDGTIVKDEAYYDIA